MKFFLILKYIIISNYRVEIEETYEKETSLRYDLYTFYKTQYQIDNANGVYKEIKDLQRDRLKYIYRQNPTFESFFSWGINQFLKIFSAYGTKPAKAIVFSIYVILIFAFIY